MQVAGQNPRTPTYVRVLKTEEKGSDVNLASHLVNDAHNRDFEVAIVISNDSDLVEPVRIVTQELGLQVGILNPHARKQRAFPVRYFLQEDSPRCFVCQSISCNFNGRNRKLPQTARVVAIHASGLVI